MSRVAEVTDRAALDAAANRAGVEDSGELLAAARRVVRIEANALAGLAERLDDSFVAAVQLIHAAPGRVIVSGIGKSGIIARKVAATLTSTGTAAGFLHPVEGLHGDLGVVGPDDVALLLSKSGDTTELAGLVEQLSRFGVPIVAVTARPTSALGRAATIVIDCAVGEEACPFDLAPTSSTTAALAVGDALAVALLLRRGFTPDDFARLHPGGAIGRRLTVTVRDVMVTGDVPYLPAAATMRACVVLLAEKRGTVAILDGANRLIGVVTAGDLTRLMEREENVFEVPVTRVMNPDPKRITADALAAAAVFQMETHGIMALPVVDTEDRLIGMVHLHDLLRANVV